MGDPDFSRGHAGKVYVGYDGCMKKSVWVAFLFVLILVASSAYSLVWEIDYTYYSDGTFTTCVGEQDFLCDESEVDYGSTSDWRVRNRTLCQDGQPAGHACQEFVNGSWTFVTCPPGV
jgi:hypothetical protein